MLAFKQRNKLGRFSDEASASTEASDQANEEASKVINLGDRCEVQLGEDAELRKRGCVRFIGTCLHIYFGFSNAVRQFINI